MKIPNVDCIIETFIRIDYLEEASVETNWWNYAVLLRSQVGPLVRRLMESGAITWYSFLVHDRQSGVPTTEDDDGFYLHLRMALTDPENESEFMRRLPDYCILSRKMQVPDPPSLDTVDINSLAGANVEQGWKILGESSEWALRLLESHDPAKPVPVQNVSQFLHYLGNQLFVRVIDIPMP